MPAGERPGRRCESRVESRGAGRVGAGLPTPPMRLTAGLLLATGDLRSATWCGRETAPQRRETAPQRWRKPATRDGLETHPTLSPRGEPLSDWLIQVLAERRLPTGVVKDWDSFEKRDPAFALAARTFLLRRGHPLPPETPPPETRVRPRRGSRDGHADARAGPLRPAPSCGASADAANRELADQVVRKLRMLGVQITETGAQGCASPVARVMAYSQSKTEALAPILSAEHRRLGERLRAVVVADFEKSSAVSAEVEHLLDAEAGGAIAAFKQLLRNPGDGRAAADSGHRLERVGGRRSGPGV